MVFFLSCRVLEPWMGAHIPRKRKGDGSLPTLPLNRAEKPGEEATTDKILENLSTRRSWFTNGMAGRVELDRGRRLRGKCKSLSKTTWNYHERRQNNSVENPYQRFALSFVSFLRRKHDFSEEFLLLYDEYSSKNSEFEPLVLTWELAFWSSSPLLKNVVTYAVAVMLQKYFRLAFQERPVLKFPIETPRSCNKATQDWLWMQAINEQYVKPERGKTMCIVTFEYLTLF